ncbi:trypsin domain-containing protein [Ditylenchus destructor]|nr:trypsin domain-containing protein [Ditylenchus destructor]
MFHLVDGSFCSPANGLQNEPSLSAICAQQKKLQVRENVAFSKLRAPVTFHAARCSTWLMAHFDPLLMPVKMSHRSARSVRSKKSYRGAPRLRRGWSVRQHSWRSVRSKKKVTGARKCCILESSRTCNFPRCAIFHLVDGSFCSPANGLQMSHHSVRSVRNKKSYRCAKCCILETSRTCNFPRCAMFHLVDGSFCSPAFKMSHHSARSVRSKKKLQVRENVAFSKLRAPVTPEKKYAPAPIPVPIVFLVFKRCAAAFAADGVLDSTHGDLCAAKKKLQVRENVAFSKLRAPVTFHAARCSIWLMAHFAPLLMAFKMSHHSARSVRNKKSYREWWFYKDCFKNEVPMLCSKGKNKVDVYKGDSGSPLSVKNSSRTDGKTQWMQVGVTSFGNVKQYQGRSVVFTRVPSYCDWIAEVTNNEATCAD